MSPEEHQTGPTINLEFVARQPGELVGERYRLISEIGRGGFGAVYRATDERLHQKSVVVKFLLGAVRHDEWADRKFAGEVKALAMIDHPGVVGVLDRGLTADGLPFLVMQHVDGVTLRSLIVPEGLPLSRAAEILRQVGRALSAAHSAGILHRDLKPENIMVQSTSSGDFVRLIDFGIATIRDESASAKLTQAAGTPAYMAPEQFFGQPSVASDVFAMGVIAWEILMGKPASWDAAEPRPDIPPVAVEAIRRAVSPDYEKRFQNAAEFGEELAIALLSASHPMTPEPTVQRIRHRVLDVAAAKQLPIHKPAEVVTLIRRTESGGLSAILEVEHEYSVTPQDVRSKAFRLEFPIGSDGRPTPLDLGLRIECPDFEPKSAFKTIQVPADYDAEPCTFLITPRFLGELRINLEVVRGEVLVTSRTLKTEAIPSDRVPEGGRTLVSIVLPVMVHKVTSPSEYTRMLGRPAAPDAGEFTRMFGTPQAPAPLRTPAPPPSPEAPQKTLVLRRPAVVEPPVLRPARRWPVFLAIAAGFLLAIALAIVLAVK